MPRPWSAAYWLARHAFLDSPEAPAQWWHLPIGLGSSQQTLIKKTHRRLAYKEILWRLFFFSTESPSSQMTVTCVKLTIYQPGQAFRELNRHQQSFCCLSSYIAFQYTQYLSGYTTGNNFLLFILLFLICLKPLNKSWLLVPLTALSMYVWESISSSSLEEL